MLSYLSGRFGNGKKVAEALLIESIINNKNTNADFFKEQLLKRFGIDASDDLLKNIVLNLSNQFNLTGNQKERNKDVVFVEPIGTEDFRIADASNRALNDETSSDFKCNSMILLRLFIRDMIFVIPNVIAAWT